MSGRGRRSVSGVSGVRAGPVALIVADGPSGHRPGPTPSSPGSPASTPARRGRRSEPESCRCSGGCAGRIRPGGNRSNSSFHPGSRPGSGCDLGLAWAHVTRTLVDRWSISDAELLATALDNLRARVAEEPPQIERATFGGTPATVLQAVGWGSALLLIPDRLGGLLGGSPRTLLTPVRNTLIAMPDDLDIDLAVAVWEAFAEEGGEELDVDPMYWTGTTVAAHPGAVEPVH